METLALPTPAKPIAIRLDPGEDVFEVLTQIARDQDIRAGFISTALGALDDAVIGYFDGEKYHQKTMKGSYELLAMNGSIAWVEGGPHLHLHATLGDSEHRVHGGHLHSARAGFLVEILIQSLGTEFTRVPRGPVLKVLTLRP